MSQGLLIFVVLSYWGVELRALCLLGRLLPAQNKNKFVVYLFIYLIINFLLGYIHYTVGGFIVTILIILILYII
jgi:hypothetical protein